MSRPLLQLQRRQHPRCPRQPKSTLYYRRTTAREFEVPSLVSPKPWHVRPLSMIAGAIASLLRDLQNRKSLCSSLLPRALATVVGAATLALAPAAEAASPEFYVNLGYQVEGAAEHCWDESEFRRSVAKMVRYDPFRSDSAVHLSVHVGGTSHAVDGRVEWRNAQGARIGERRFSAKDGNCIKLLTEMSFAVGLQIELLRPKATPAAPSAATTAASPSTTPPTTAPGTTPPATPAGTTPPPAPAGTTPPATPGGTPLPASPKTGAATSPTSTTPPTSTAPPTSTIPPRWSTWLGGGPALALGIAPSLAGHARLFFAVRRDDLSGELAIEGTLPVSERRSDGSGFREQLLGGGAALCGHRFALSACLLGKVSVLRASGFGVDETRSPNSLLLHTGLRVAATWQLARHWFALPHFDTLLLLTPRVVELDHVPMWAMPRFGASAGIDLAARFP